MLNISFFDVANLFDIHICGSQEAHYQHKY